MRQIYVQEAEFHESAIHIRAFDFNLEMEVEGFRRINIFNYTLLGLVNSLLWRQLLG